MEDRIAVIGAGSWGTALAISLALGGRDVSLWARRSEAAEVMRTERHNPTYLPRAIIPDGVQVTSDLESAIRDRGVWLFATPSQSVREVAGKVAGFATPKHVLVSVAKGIENGTLLTTSGVLREAVPTVPAERIGVLYGPSHAEEVAAAVPTAVVVAFDDLEVAEHVQDLFMSPRLRVYSNPDLLGVEIAGSVKNILAIATGICDGVGYGDNAKAALITRGIAEIKRLGVAMGAREETFSGLAGIGDLVVTCMSRHSRNRYVGEQIGKGRALDDIRSEMKMVAEGVRTAVSVHELAARHKVEMPIVEAVYDILFNGKAPRAAVHDLMTRAAKREDRLYIDSPA
ncbi:MAG: NAD(P)H-dependent glycerol-3-phosphate dehydrogenase [Rhodothermales bacterium]|nr:NAD(P)H-dependent glycerol-3-phosphate dehydrogenase [Rhodothermales bacterium]MBO6781582.1 NAD(P)H-dependent glycerol-3-phosphate dehydrogenase [Rhodothermales bacterium]